MFPSLYFLVKDVQGDEKIIIINTSNCGTSLYQKSNSKALMFIKQVKPNTNRERKTHILYFYKYFSPFAQNIGAGHAASEPRRRTSHYENRP